MLVNKKRLNLHALRALLLYMYHLEIHVKCDKCYFCKMNGNEETTLCTILFTGLSNTKFLKGYLDI